MAFKELFGFVQVVEFMYIDWLKIFSYSLDVDVVCDMPSSIPRVGNYSFSLSFF